MKDGAMRDDPGPREDRYSRVDYRRLIAWETRIQRETPFLRRLLEAAPDRSVLDVGCGTGEHTAFFAELGARAVGLDSSESMLEKARDHEAAGKGRFVLGEALRARAALGEEPPFGLVICLGNMLPHVREDDELARLLEEVRACLVPGGIFLLQLIDYRRILDDGIRHLPLNFRDGDDGEEIVFLRVLRAVSERCILFFPTTLSLHAEADEPIRVASTRRVELRPWTDRDLVPELEARGFALRLHGDMEEGDYDPRSSSDLVVVATLDPTPSGP